MATYTIIWGHSGTHGREWTTAREASRYAAEVWGEVEADTPEAAARVAADETGEGLIDFWHDDDTDRVHVILGEPTFAAILRGARADLGLSQRAMAEALGIPQRTYESWEGGQEPQHPSIVLAAVRGLD